MTDTTTPTHKYTKAAREAALATRVHSLCVTNYPDELCSFQEEFDHNALITSEADERWIDGALVRLEFNDGTSMDARVSGGSHVQTGRCTIRMHFNDTVVVTLLKEGPSNPDKEILMTLESIIKDVAEEEGTESADWNTDTFIAILRELRSRGLVEPRSE